MADIGKSGYYLKEGKTVLLALVAGLNTIISERKFLSFDFMKQFRKLVGLLVLSLLVCGEAAASGTEANTLLGKLMDSGAGAMQALEQMQEKEEKEFRARAKSEKEDLEAQQKLEKSQWSQTQKEEVKQLEAQGYKYLSPWAFNNPLKKAHPIAEEAAERHKKELNVMKARHKQESRNLSSKNNIRALHESQRAQRNAFEKMNETRFRGAIFGFLIDVDAETFVTTEELNRNPFVYEGKTVVARVMLDSMISRDEALFSSKRGSPIVVSNVPTTRFANKDFLLLVGKVVGNRTWKTPIGGEMIVGHMSFVDACECNQNKRYRDNDWISDRLSGQ